MGWRAGSKGDVDQDTKSTGSKRGIIWILAGVVVTGLAAGYSWLRRLPK